MALRVIGAGLPRTGTSSLRAGLETLLGGPCLHMSAIPGHPFDLGQRWRHALAGETPDWPQLVEGYVAAVDWPASMFWRELSAASPDAPVLLSARETAEIWWQSIEATILPGCADGARAGLAGLARSTDAAGALRRQRALGRPDHAHGSLRAAQHSGARGCSDASPDRVAGH